VWIQAASGKIAIYDSPVVLNVINELPTQSDSLFFSLAGKGMLGAGIGHPTSFEILVVGAGKRPVDINMDKLVVTIGSRLGGKMRVYCEKVGPGKYVVEYTPTSAGNSTVLVVYDEVEVCSQAITFDTGIDPSKCVVVNPPRHVDVGVQSSFVIDSRTGLGGRLARGGEKFDVGVDGPENGVHGLVVRDESTGSYTVRFRLVAPGRYQFYVSLRKVPISGSPVVVNAS